jgi:hypothetical protein
MRSINFFWEMEKTAERSEADHQFFPKMEKIISVPYAKTPDVDIYGI